MPIYEFKCLECGHYEEILGKINDASTTVCPNCKKFKFQKLISASSFQLSGTGWYATDFKNKQMNKKEKKNLSRKEVLKEND